MNCATAKGTYEMSRDAESDSEAVHKARRRGSDTRLPLVARYSSYVGEAKFGSAQVSEDVDLTEMTKHYWTPCGAACDGTGLDWLIDSIIVTT